VDRWRDRIEAEKDELRKSVGDENYDYIMARIKNIDPEKRWLEPHEIWIDCEKRGIEISEWALKHIIEEEARVKQAEQVKQLNREDLELLEKLEKNPELLKEGNNLRRLFSILPYTEDIEGHMYGAGEGGLHFQYEVVLILNSNAVSNKKGDWIWRVLKPGEMKGDELLGVVVIMPDRKMVERVVGLSAKAGKFSHPVFTSRGNVAYPKPEKQDSGPEKSESPKREKKPSRTKRKKK